MKQPYVNESHKSYCALRFMTSAQASILRRNGDQPCDLHCRCKPNPHIVRVRAFAAMISDQRARGVDPWSDEGWAERLNGKRVKRHATNGHEQVLPATALGVMDAWKALRAHEAEGKRIRQAMLDTVRAAVAAGERPARLARMMGLSRQRVNQLLTSKGR